MNLEQSTLVVRMSLEEAYSTACDINEALKNSIETHWKKFDKDKFLHEEKDRLFRLRSFLQWSGYGALYDHFIQEYTKEIEK